MTSAPKHAPSSAKATEGKPVEPDFDQWALELDGDYSEAMLEDVAVLLHAAFAAGRHSSCEALAKQEAAPQPEGGPEKVRMAADMSAGEFIEQLQGATKARMIRYIENRDGAYLARIAALEAALRECEADYAEAWGVAALDVSGEDRPGRLMREHRREQLAARLFTIRRVLYQGLTTAGAGKGEK